MRLVLLTAAALMTGSTMMTASGAAAFSPKELESRTVERRAVEAVIGGIPAVNYDLML